MGHVSKWIFAIIKLKRKMFCTCQFFIGHHQTLIKLINTIKKFRLNLHDFKYKKLILKIDRAKVQ